MFSERDKQFMKMAIEKAREGIAAGQTPFGACIVTSDGKVASCGHNEVWASTDITAHGEVNALRLACQALGRVDLSGCTIYSTTEPCPMCFSAIHWAKIGRIVYGAAISDAQTAGFNELAISNDRMKQESGSPIMIEAGCLQKECVNLFAEWKKFGKAKLY